MKNRLPAFVTAVIFGTIFTGTTTDALAQDCTATASGNNIDVNAGQVVCVTSDIYNANVNVASGGTLKVASGYTLSIQNFNNFNGTLINNGTLITGNVNFGNGGTLINNNSLTFNGTSNFNGSGTITNNKNAVITYNVTFSLNNNATFNNSGTVIAASGDATVNSGCSFNNYGRFEVRSGNFNSGGTLTNNGFIKVNDFINFNGGNVYNNCRFVVGNGFNNAAVFVNDGLMWVTNTSTGKIQNNAGSWTNTYRGKVRGTDFHNNAPLSGSGEFYFTGDTRQQSSFSGSYNSPDSAIKFYDASLTSPQQSGSYFDFGMQGNHVVRPASMVPGDTASFYGYCGQQTFQPSGITPLPLKLIRFDAALMNKEVLLSWETAQEIDVKGFTIEYSKDGSSWATVGSIAATGNGSKQENSYRFTHYNPAATVNLYRLRMEDVDGLYTYSPVRSVAIAAGDNAISVYPNPFSGKLSLAFDNNNPAMQIQLQVFDLSGKLMQQATLNATNQQWDLSHLAPGIYFLQGRDLNGGATILQKKIIKK
ncbi:T9SS type A sorting domain-containing protein [Taibaiella koreensis]|uniref:T9SS type A sorting domain-containing protein n=1 Tax=Taibaiella koreensis TaxID=1268548 RepID=UPI000E59EA90|nr:T9SS type A sorting domain-containing protein [Taibaiella koreensis]